MLCHVPVYVQCPIGGGAISTDSTAKGVRMNAASPRLDPAVRRLKIEEDGDFFRGLIKPKIRLMGRWLERAGFRPGTHVCVTCLAPGVIELRSDAFVANGHLQASPEQPDCPF